MDISITAMSSRWTWGRRRFLQLLGMTTATGAAGCGEDAGQAQADNLTEDEFDFVVVGSGAGGGPLACNLARAGHRVLLLEAGNDQGQLTSQQVPSLHVRSTEEPTMRWDYFVKHYDDPDQAAADSKFVADPGPHHEPGVLYPRAGTLGGCTAHNAMITIYPHASDFDRIADLTGDDSWRAGPMRRYFELLENCLYIDPGDGDEAEGHGFAGWLSTTMPDASIGLTDLKIVKILLSAASTFSASSFWDDPFGSLFGGDAFPIKQLLGLLRRDVNADAPGRDGMEGLFGIPQATDGQRRVGPRDFILRTVAEGYPLVVLTDALATRVLFDGTDDAGRPVARGVEVMLGEYLYRASPLSDPSSSEPSSEARHFFARHEVILSAGAFNTPQLLKLSGIGPRDELDAFGIETLVDLPGVGTNLQDRYEVGVVSEMSSDLSTVEDCTFGVLPDPCLEEWERGDGPYTSLGAVGSIVLKSRPERLDTDLIIFGLPGMFRGYYPDYGSKDVYAHKDRFTWAILKAHTENHAGTVTLRSADPRDMPDIRFRYFHEGTTAGGEDQRDLDAVLEGVSFVRRMNQVTDFKLLFSKYEEVVPGPAYETDEDVRGFVRNEAWGHHASCTCPIGADGDPMAVLDSKLRVRGTAGLRVVDASVFPEIPGFFIVVPIYMVSEKATDEILAELGEVRA